MTTTLKFLRAAVLLMTSGVPSIALAQVATGDTPGASGTAHRTKTGAATVTIIAMTRVNYPPHKSAKMQAKGNKEDASDEMHRKGSALTGSKPTQRELIVDFQ